MRVATDTSPPAIIAMPTAMETGVPILRAHFVPTPVKLRATTVRAIGAVRRPASRGP
ncbi:hypothetical protein SGRIM128S_03354 [Streptomyces griseomycini]